MKALADRAPTPNVSGVEHEGARWLVTVFSRERARCPVCCVTRNGVSSNAGYFHFGWWT